MTSGGVRGAVRAALFDNLGLKILSLLFALGFYAFIHGAENVQKTLAISVVSVMPPETARRQLMTQLPTTVAVTVRGSPSQLNDLRDESIGSLQLDLRGGNLSHIDLDASMFHVPAGLTVDQIYPPTIDMRWDDVIVRSIPVQVPRTGELAPGFLIKGAVGIDPPSVNVRGPRSIVEVIQLARTAPFEVGELAEGTYRRKLALEAPPKPVTYDVDSVEATIEVVRELASRTFDRKVEVVGLPRAKTLPATVSVRIVGTPEDVNALVAEAVIPRVEPKAANVDTTQPGSVVLEVLVDVARVKAEVNPPKVVVKW